MTHVFRSRTFLTRNITDSSSSEQPEARVVRVSQTQWLDPDEMRAWQSYIRATMRVRHAFETTLQEATGLIPDDYAVLMKLSEAEGHRQLMSELAALLLTPTSSMTFGLRFEDVFGPKC